MGNPKTTVEMTKKKTRQGHKARPPVEEDAMCTGAAGEIKADNAD